MFHRLYSKLVYLAILSSLVFSGCETVYAGGFTGPSLASITNGSDAVLGDTSVDTLGVHTPAPAEGVDVKGVVAHNGTGTISSVGAAITGVGTHFTTQLTTNMQISADGVTVNIVAIADDTHLTVDEGPGAPWSADAFTYSLPSFKIRNSAGDTKISLFPSGDIKARTITTSDQPNFFHIGGGATPPLSIGFGDDTVYHRLRSYGGANLDIGLDVLNPTTHYFAVNGQFQNNKGAQIGYAFGTTPATGGLNVSGYTKIGGAAVSGAPSIQGDAINFEIGSANSGLGNIFALSNNTFSNPFTFFTNTLGIPARIYSMSIESDPTHGGEAKKIFTSSDSTVIDYDAYLGSASPSQPAYRFTATKSNGSGGNASFSSAETVYTFNNRSTALFFLTGDGAGHFNGGAYVGTSGTSAVPAFKFPTGDGIYSVAQGEIGLSMGNSNFDAGRFSYAGGTDTVWKFNTALHLKDFSGNEIMSFGGTDLSFYGGSRAVQQAVGSTLTNNVTSGGSSDTINDITGADVDATAAKLTDTRNAIYQLTVKVRKLEAALKAVSLVKN